MTTEFSDQLAFDNDLDVRRAAKELHVSKSCSEHEKPASTPVTEDEGVFEIRDFSNVSDFERWSHQISLAAKRWGAALQAAESSDDVLQMRECFEQGNFQYELLFQLVPLAETKKEDRLGLHAFPTRAHRLQRWFGVRHFVIISINKHNIDVDSARTLLGAAAIAVSGAKLPLPLSCFVPVEGGRKRVLGEALQGNRTIYSTDLQNTVQPCLEHLAGLADFFQKKVQAGADKKHTMMVGARFTYSADHFELWQQRFREKFSVEAHEHMADPVESLKLHCLWPAFPFGAFVDDAHYSELDPRTAPYWKLRVLRRDSSAPLTQRLRALLSFRREACTIRSAEHSIQMHAPRTAMGSLTAAIQESLESILLPTDGEMQMMVEACMESSVVPTAESPPPALRGLKGGRCGGRLVRIAELSATMRCFKGSVMLWCNVLARMRTQWDALEAPGSVAPPTARISARGTRTEFFDASMCLAQQKMELLQCSVAACRTRADPDADAGADAEKTELETEGRGSMRPPSLAAPPLLTEDVLLQRDTAAASLTAAEVAELDGREMRSDMAAFRAANPGAALTDFLQWRQNVEGLSLKFPEDWLQSLWNEPPCWSKLFEPEREAEMALHYLESIEGTQLLLQLFRVLLRSTLEDLSAHIAATGGGPAYIRMLRDRVISAAVCAFSWRGNQKMASEEVDVEATLMGEVADFPEEEYLQGVLAALEVLESSMRLAASLRAKLGGQAEGLLEELLTEGEADVTADDQREVIEMLFDSSRHLARDEIHSSVPLAIFDTLPLAKEFVLQLQPAAGEQKCMRRLYAEVREDHTRLAVVRELAFW
ncbi:unnamed protein product [Effrenium voratum]|uniref:Rab3 GTPase-activating protein catalytic subunit n=1 Tax=Effrenium voratum TaxID=2562239 RepID=A0AA36JM37_9DINO|nr:unnamed protein product [Effrenium voratum]CAJ1408753.1 unnamed protein product [Effrenium voratum]